MGGFHWHRIPPFCLDLESPLILKSKSSPPLVSTLKTLLLSLHSCLNCKHFAHKTVTVQGALIWTPVVETGSTPPSSPT
ncbi:hypothetical protein Goshw_003422 [Gossypium schwendimanii]|uniref:Uncharacterized protein n=1 Tax=Gossypium schwendimanii TaxID=34291 RepID=A0A7J9MWE3_GOSSC|nr:hypothetical protein [Gossypium schwendimanii]